MNAELTVCICTYNRLHYLQKCVDRLLPQIASQTAVLTIVDNNSGDGTKDYVQSLIEQKFPVQYLFEAAQGLSYARNKGWKRTERPWILYIDDDCFPPRDFILNAINHIHYHKDIDAAGGPVYPLFETSPPAWVPEGFGEFSMPYKEFKILENGYIRGGCFLIKRSVLEKLNGFNPFLGVKGDQLAYGEEIELQDRMRKEGFKIAYAPSIAIHHFVRTEKLTPWWMLRSEYQRRRDKMNFQPVSKIAATKNLLQTIGGRVARIPLNASKMIYKKHYSFNHFLLDSFKPLAYRWGEFIGSFRKNREP